MGWQKHHCSEEKSAETSIEVGTVKTTSWSKSASFGVALQKESANLGFTIDTSTAAESSRKITEKIPMEPDSKTGKVCLWIWTMTSELMSESVISKTQYYALTSHPDEEPQCDPDRCAAGTNC